MYIIMEYDKTVRRQFCCVQNQEGHSISGNLWNVSSLHGSDVSEIEMGAFFGAALQHPAMNRA
jgi:hypothetical protein